MRILIYVQGIEFPIHAEGKEAAEALDRFQRGGGGVVAVDDKLLHRRVAVNLDYVVMMTQ